MNFNVMDDGVLMQQDVGLNYEGNYMQIDTPAMDGKTPATIIHHGAEVKFNIILIWSLHI